MATRKYTDAEIRAYHEAMDNANIEMLKGAKKRTTKKTTKRTTKKKSK